MKFSLKLAAFYLLIGSNVLFSQSNNIEWSTTIGGSDIDLVAKIEQTSDGGFIIGGTSRSVNYDVSGNHGSMDFWVVKLNSIGGIEWQRSLGGSDFDELADIVSTSDGGYIVVGRTYSTDGDVTSSLSGYNVWVVKLSSSGSIQWQQTFGGSSYDVGNAVVQTPGGGYAVLAKTSSQDGDVTGNHGNSDIWIVKLDNQGNLEWQKTLGGSGSDEGQGIMLTSDNGYLVTGSTGSNDGDVTQHIGQIDYWIVKLDSSGNLIWEKTYGGSHMDYAYKTQFGSDNSFVVIGSSLSADGDVSNPSGDIDGWMIKIDTIGNLLWEKSLGNPNWNWLYDIGETLDGGYILGGETALSNGFTKGYIVKTDANGMVLFEEMYGGTYDEKITSLVTTSDNGVVFAATAKSNDGDLSSNYGMTDIWIVKLNANLSLSEMIPNNRELVKITNLLGQEVRPDSEGLLIYIYSDGSIEKTMRVK